MSDDEQNSSKPTFLRQRRSKKNRQTKTQLIFDENARRDYLKGFHKRKLERRERAQKELEDEIKTDLKNLRQKRREEMNKKHEALGLVDVVESQPKKRTVEMKNHTIEIAEIDDEFISQTGLFMGANQVENSSQNDAETSEKPMTKSKRPLSKKMSILQNMKTPKTSQPKGKIRRSKVKYGKNGGVQTASKKKRTRQ